MFFNTHNSNFFISYPKKLNYNEAISFQSTSIIFNSYHNFEETEKNIKKYMDVDYFLFELNKMTNKVKSIDYLSISKRIFQVYQEFELQKNLDLLFVDKNKAKDVLVL
jgi:hypothetical protein